MADQSGKKTGHGKEERCNPAFKCNFCNGGQDAGHLGFRGVCSDTLLQYNVRQKKHIWCAYKESPCRQYWDGKITRRDLDTGMQQKQMLVCYESRMLLDWKASAGVYRSGSRKGTPIPLRKVRHNSLTVLTTRDPASDKEQERFIFAVFMVDTYFEGDSAHRGYAAADAKWRLELSPEQAHKIKFWNYYANSNPENIQWDSRLFRYLSDEQAVQILRDIAAMKCGTADQEFARQFLEHFCSLKGINAEAVPSPCGALMRVH